jgi:glucosylceramidase
VNRWYRSAIARWPNRLKAAVAAAAAALAIITLTGLQQPPPNTTAYTSWWANKNPGAGKCMGVVGGNMTNGTPVVQWSCNGHPDQSWEIQVVNGSPGGIWTQIRNFQDPNKCLGVLGSTTFDGSNLVIWDCNGSGDQEWFFQSVPNFFTGFPSGNFNIINGNADPKVIGILNMDPSDGAQAVIWDNLGPTHPDQEWAPIQR